MNEISENNKRVFSMQSDAIIWCKRISAVLLAVISAAILIFAVVQTNNVAEVENVSMAKFFRISEALEEDYEDETICPVEYISEDGEYRCTINYSYEEWEELPTGHHFIGNVYHLDDGRDIAFDHEASDTEIEAAVRDLNSNAVKRPYGIAMAIGFMAISLVVMLFFGGHFTNYEQIWFLSIMILACIVSVFFPEEDTNGVNGIIIMGLYLADTFLNILCELLISKQSKWNFIVSVFVELTEIAICVVLAYRFATMASTLFFWLPIDIISFINWNKHPDKVKEELTEVRKLSGLAEFLIITGIVVWTVVIGYILTRIDIGTELFNGNETLKTLVCYLDACVSAVGIANGVFILLRYREQWIAWYIDAVLEGVINILSGQYVLLVLKLGFLTNTTYGYIKWTKYIKEHPEALAKKEVF